VFSSIQISVVMMMKMKMKTKIVNDDIIKCIKEKNFFSI
jgi:hypothetical protein